MNIRNRVKEIRTVRLKDIRPNPRNWRTHPVAQADALRGVLSEVGWAGVVLAYEPEDGGGLMYIDGHLREEVVPDMEAQVAVLDVTDAEANYLLATHDPLTALATANASALDELIAGIETNNAAVREILEDGATEERNKPLFRILDTSSPPKMTWVLIGIPTVRIGEINEHIEKIATIPGVFCEMSANNETD